MVRRLNTFFIPFRFVFKENVPSMRHFLVTEIEKCKANKILVVGNHRTLENISSEDFSGKEVFNNVSNSFGFLLKACEKLEIVRNRKS